MCASIQPCHRDRFQQEPRDLSGRMPTTVRFHSSQCAKVAKNNYKYVFKMQFKQVRTICGCKLQNLAFSFLDDNCAVPGSNSFYIYGLVH
jgi:hypothetical protein